MNIKKYPIKDIKLNPENPRVVRNEQFKKLVKSIQDFPEMLSIRPIVVNNDMVVLGGNMRLKACKDAGLKEIPVLIADELTEEQQREFIIKDNVGYGDWDLDVLLQEWDTVQLEEWGLDLPEFNITPEAFGEDFSIPDGDRQPIRQMTFTVADEQEQVIKEALKDIKGTDAYKYCETFGNINSNGNALYLIVSECVELKK
jgi:ParB-like chromosome segregation protein Spo0J